MRFKFLVAALTSALAIVSTVAAEQGPETQQPTTTSDATPSQAPAPNAAGAAPGSLDEIVCEIRKEPYTGTHISHRRKVCKTRREWEEEKRIADKFLNKIQKDGGSRTDVAGAKGP